MKDLDLLAAQTGQEIIAQTESRSANDVENLITKSLGVLQENGVYAALLYLYSRSNTTEKPIAVPTRKNLLALLRKLDLSAPEGNDATVALKFLTDDICSNLDRLLLVKQLWEQTLIYTRYGAKARSAAEG